LKTTEQFTRALERYQQSANKSWSLTDCANFQIMESGRIHAALAHDQHLARTGYEALLR
jgi:predicted nucleic acid-binding protein